LGDLNDNVLEFKAKKPDLDDEQVTISLEDDGISHAFEALRITAVGLMNDEFFRCEGSDVVHASIILISWMAKQSGVTVDELVEFFQSIELTDFDE